MLTYNRLFTAALALLIGCASAVAFRIKGTVSDTSNQPVVGAMLSACPGKAAAITDGQGRYEFQIPEGTYTLTISAFGYSDLTITLEVKADATRNFTLSADSTITLSEVEVVGSASRNLKQGALNANAIDVKSLMPSVNNLTTLVDRSAGIKIRRQGGLGSDYDLAINGLSGNSIRFFIDGVPLDTRGSNVSLDNIPLNTISRVEVFKGVVPAYLGSDALGGAVNIVTDKSRRNYLDASVSIGSFHTWGADAAAQIAVPRTPLLVRPSFSFKSSKNDYTMKGVEVWNEDNHRYETADLPRFHDDFLSAVAQIEAGVREQAWADQFFLSASYSKIDKEIQTGAMQNKVYGQAHRYSHAWSIAARYAKSWEKWQLHANISHTWDNSETVDTAMRKYSWDGSWLPSSGNEINNRAPSIRLYHRPFTSLVAGASYTLGLHHSLAIDYSLNRTGNKRSDKVDKTFENTDDALTKHIVGLSCYQRLFDDRMVNTYFIKDYINDANIRQRDLGSLTGANSLEKTHTVRNYFGGGLGSRFEFFGFLSLKASYEHSVRLPMSHELLGNGTTIMPNVILKPESSDNINFGAFGNIRIGDATLSYEAMGFIRNVKDYIRAQVSEREGMMQYGNEPAVHVKGADFEIGYSWRELHISLNGSYNDSRNMRRYKSDGKPSATYRNRIPNKPWVFANAEADYSFRNLISGDDRLRIGAAYQWVHWYYLNWEAYGAEESKARIPEQNAVSLSLTYSLKNDRYSISLECDNIFNATLYDNYMLQKPGRSLTAKFRIFIN